MDVEGSADFVVLVVDEHGELAGVQTCMHWHHSRNHQRPFIPLKEVCFTRLKGSEAGILSEKKQNLVPCIETTEPWT